MLKAMKSYWAFTSDIYKLVMFVVVPILLIPVNLYLLEKDIGNGFEFFFVLYAVDTLSDFFFMGGFYKKSNSSLEFLQSSSRFVQMSREITIVDIVRRILFFQIPYVVILLWSIGNPEAMEWCRGCAFLPWLEILIAQWAVLVTRRYVEFNQATLCVSSGYFILVVCCIMGFIFCEIQPVITVIVLIVLILITSIINVWYTGKKVRESYYDE